jgi:ligand-binding SRPBCC domain-containing protein
MIRGPYRKWEHVHTFETIRGRTVVGDQVYYELPLGWIGELAHGLFVKSDLKDIFKYRAKKLAEIFP